MILFIFNTQLCLATLSYQQTDLPFPADLYTENYPVTDTITNNCIKSLLADANCNSENNTPECEYDGGDCCSYTCENAQYNCGSGGYDCIENTQCGDCVTAQGECKSMADCFSQPNSVKAAITNCIRNDISQGNAETTAFFCGRDSDLTFIHDPNNLATHYPGCGLSQGYCTYTKCCTDIRENNVTPENCDDTVRTATSYNPLTGKTQTVNESCLTQFYECFKLNMRYSFGQCCECQEGWWGKSCSEASCVPACEHGDCVAPDVCECEEGWSGGLCNSAECSNCVNGKCIEAEICRCDEFWEGLACDVPYSKPECSNGVVNEPNVCTCNEGYTGIDCRIPVCGMDCGNGWCIDIDTCECFPPYYTSGVEEFCRDIVCRDWFGIYCSSCTREQCEQCTRGLVLMGGKCESCTEIDLFCVRCEGEVCLECGFPYKLLGGVCRFAGYFEFSSKEYSAYKGETVVLTVLRSGDSYGGVSLDVVSLDETAYFEYRDGGGNLYNYVKRKVTFADGELEQSIEIETYFSFEIYEESKRFVVVLFNLEGDGILRKTHENGLLQKFFNDLGQKFYTFAYVELLDSPSTPHLEYTEISLNGESENPITLTVDIDHTILIVGFSDENAGISQGGSLFIISLYKMAIEDTEISCFFPTYDFTGEFLLVSEHTGIDIGNGSYSYTLNIKERGMYRVYINLSVPGALTTIWVGDNLTLSPVQKYIGYTVGEINRELYKGNNNNYITWECKYIPEETVTASFYAGSQAPELITISLDKIELCSSASECTSIELSLLKDKVYSLQVTHSNTNSDENLSVSLKTPESTFPISPVYAPQSLKKFFDLFLVSQSECH